VSVLLVLVLFLVAFLIRAWGARFGLPDFTYHPDEHATVERATAILRTGDHSPHWFNYPSAYIYVQALSYIPYFLISAARGFGNAIPDPAPYGFYFAGRLMTAFVGALTVPLVCVLGDRLYGRRTALVSSAFLTFCLLHVVHSHYVTTDVPAAFFVTWTLLFCSMVITKPAKKYTVLAALFAGLSASTKYPGAIALLPVLVAQIMSRASRGWERLGPLFGIAVGAFLGGFLLGTPYAFLELATFLGSLASVLGHYGASQPGFEGGNTWLWYLQQTLTSADVALAGLGLAGIVWVAVKHRRGDLMLLSFIVPYYLLISIWPVRFERNLVPLVPALAVLAGRWLVESVCWLGSKWPALRRWEMLILSCLTAVAVVMPAKAVLDLDGALSQRDHRNTAADWVNTNLPPGSKIVIEGFPIAVDEERFELVQLVRIDSEDLRWYLAEGVEYVIVSDGHWRILFADPERHAREIATYQDIVNRSTVVQEFPGNIPAILSRGYPTIPIYHFPDVLILQLESSASEIQTSTA
jgi:4-amino-4-deoxy-L-arabinose transferase-like glycosyltransferase